MLRLHLPLMKCKTRHQGSSVSKEHCCQRKWVCQLRRLVEKLVWIWPKPNSLVVSITVWQSQKVLRTWLPVSIISNIHNIDTIIKRHRILSNFHHWPIYRVYLNRRWADSQWNWYQKQLMERHCLFQIWMNRSEERSDNQERHLYYSKTWNWLRWRTWDCRRRRTRSKRTRTKLISCSWVRKQGRSWRLTLEQTILRSHKSK